MQADRVLKFGGTSVGTPEAVQRTARHVLRSGARSLVVVSAVGGVTDLLLEAGARARRGEDYSTVVAEIRRRHEAIAAAVGFELAELAPLRQEFERLLAGASLLGELSPRVKDALVSLGERTSVLLVAAAIRHAGGQATAFASWDLGLITDERFGSAEPLARSAGEIRERVAALPEGPVPVVTGFLGHSESGEITTLGRGGSDFSAALFGAALGVEEIQIWTDVPGILRADPKIVPEAQIVPEVCYEEAAELAYFGAKVLHPRTLEPAQTAGIPVRVLSTFGVDPEDPTPLSEQGTVVRDTCAASGVRALAIQKKVQTLHLHSLHMMAAHGFLERVFHILARHRVSVDVVATSEVSVSMTLDLFEGDLEAPIRELQTFAEVRREPGRSILCLVGAGLRDDTSLLARVFQILAQEQVPVHVISQGASRINITIVTEPPFGERGMRALHRELFS